jgi:hypothetical protein
VACLGGFDFRRFLRVAFGGRTALPRIAKEKRVAGAIAENPKILGLAVGNFIARRFGWRRGVGVHFGEKFMAGGCGENFHFFPFTRLIFGLGALARFGVALLAGKHLDCRFGRNRFCLSPNLDFAEVDAANMGRTGIRDARLPAVGALAAIIAVARLSFTAHSFS